MKNYILCVLVSVACATSLFGSEEWHVVGAGKQNNNKAFVNAAFRKDYKTLNNLLPGVDNHAKGIALIHAINHNDLKLFNRLLQAGADVGVRNEEGRTPLMLASYKGRNDFIDSLLRYRAPVDEQDDQGSTALMYAASGGHVKAVQRLIHAGAQVNMSDKVKGRTPLHWALRMREGSAKKNGHLNAAENVHQIITVLLESGARVDIEDREYGRTPIDWAEEMKWPEELKLMNQYAHSNKQNSE